MDIRNEQNEKNRVSFVVTVAQEESGKYELPALQELGRDLEVPGFRRGKVSSDVVRTHIKPEALFAKTAEIAAGHAAAEVLLPHAEKIVGPPRITLLKAAPGNPLEVRVEADLLPEIDLKNWKQLRITRNPVSVDEKEIDDAVEWLRKSRAKFRAVLRPAQKGDFVELSFHVRLDGQELQEAGSERYPVVLGEGKLIPGFEEQLLGMRQNEERSFTLDVPESWPHPKLAGKKTEFLVKLMTLQERILPELSDDFAQAAGKFETLDALRKSTREGLQQEHEQKEKRRVKAEALRLLAKRVQEPLPQALITQERENLWEEFSSSLEAGGMKAEEYFAHVGKNVDDFKQELEAPALERAKAALVLRALAQEERIEPSEEEAEAEAAAVLRGAQDPNALEGKLDPNALRDYARARVRNEKTLQLIYEVVTRNL